MLPLPGMTETTVQALGAAAFTWINEEVQACCYYGEGTMVSGATEESEPPRQAGSRTRRALLDQRSI
jgi:hypothetical protein